MSDIEKKCVIYTVLKKGEQGENPPVLLKEYAESLGFTVDKEFIEKQGRRKKNPRKQFEKMLEYLDNAPVDTVVFERMGRWQEDKLAYILLCKRDFTLYFRREKISLTKNDLMPPILRLVIDAFN